MRKVILSVIGMAALSSTLMASGVFTQDMQKAEAKVKLENKQLCKIYKAKIVNYNTNRRSDNYATTTLKHYITTAQKYCFNS